MPSPSSATIDAQLVPGRDRDRDLEASGVLAHIGQRLPQDGEDLLAQLDR